MSTVPITACEWRVGPPGFDEIRIVERAQRDGSVLYAVKRTSWVRRSVELTSSPVAAMLGGVLVVGCEREESGDLRLYLGARYLNEYIVFPAGEDADRAERAWDATHSSHLWLVERERRAT